MANQNTDAMSIYAKLGTTPKEAQKTIGAGKLKGMTDINPMFRIKRMTEVFGPQGKGWKFDNVKLWTDEAGGEIVAWCSLELRVKFPGSDEWSEPIFGIGGSKMCGKGVGDGANDECFKMAFTDAQGIAMKGLGMCADIYYQKDRTRYSNYDESKAPEAKAEAPASEGEPAKPQFCTDEEEAIRDFYNLVDIKAISKLYNEKYGGNANVTPAIKKLVAKRIDELNKNSKNTNQKSA